MRVEVKGQGKLKVEELESLPVPFLHCNLPYNSRPLCKYSCCSCYFANQVLFLFPFNRKVTFDLVASFRTVTIKTSFFCLLPYLQCLLNFQVFYISSLFNKRLFLLPWDVCMKASYSLMLQGRIYQFCYYPHPGIAANWRELIFIKQKHIGPA